MTVSAPTAPESIPAGSSVFIAEPNGVLFREVCHRCGGSGTYSWNPLTGDVCFRCEGTKREPGAPVTRERVLVLADQRAKAQARRDAERARQFEATRADRERANAEREALLAQREAELASWQWLSAGIGETVTVSGTVDFFHDIEGAYGWSRLVVVLVDDTHKVKTFTTASWAYGIEQGEAITLSAVVKAHDTYEGERATVLARPKRVAQ